MKFNKILLPSIALATIMASCDDQIMEWQDSDSSVNSSELPLKELEKLSLYKPIKDYVAQYRPNLNLAIGIGADQYLNEPTVTDLVNNNFTGITLGNAMKMGVMVNASGKVDFTTVDQILAALPAGMKLYGHNLLWHTQQPQTYLKGLIAPEMQVVADDNDVCVNIIGNPDFDENINGWISWSHHTKEYFTPGYESDGCIKLSVDNKSTQSWDDQMFWELNTPLEPGVTYAYQFWARTDTPGAIVQFMYQNTSNANQGWGANCELGSNWVKFTGEFVLDDAKNDVTRVGLQFGGMEADIYVDGFKFGVKKDAPANPDEGRLNYITNGTFDENVDGSAAWNGGDCKSWNETEGNLNPGCLQVVTAEDNPGNQWKVQIHMDLAQPIPAGSTAYISYYIKTLEGAGSVRAVYNR